MILASQIKFPLGQVVITPNALEKLNSDDILNALNRHVVGDWGELDEEDRSRPFYRDLNESDWAKINTMVERLLNWTSWSSPPNSEIDSQLPNSKSVLKTWFKSKGLTTSYLLGASE